MLSAIQGISSIIGTNYEEERKLTGEESFTYALEAAKSLIQSNLESEAEVETLTLDFITGKSDDIAGLLIAQEKSSILLQYTLQIRNGVVSAYKELMNLSV